MKRPYLLFKHSHVWYYRLSNEKNFHTTGQRKRNKAEAYVVGVDPEQRKGAQNPTPSELPPVHRALPLCLYIYTILMSIIELLLNISVDACSMVNLGLRSCQSQAVIQLCSKIAGLTPLF
jgi:hypothetical protein